MLSDRAYIGEVGYRSGWYPSKHMPIVDRATWDCVQALLGNGQQLSHTMTYASDLLECGHCGHKITGEWKIKKTKSGQRDYLYYRCTKYNKSGHPRIRVTEAELDHQVFASFDKMRIEDEGVREWFRAVLASKTKEAQADTRARRAELQRQETMIAAQQDRLLNLRIDDQIDEVTFNRKQTEMRDRLSAIMLQLEILNRTRGENTEGV